MFWMFTRKKIGIDLGTANTLVFVEGKGIVLQEPTVVAVHSVTGKIEAIGSEAKEMVGRTPDTVIVYKPMQDGVIADFKITQLMIRYFIDKALGKKYFLKPDVLVSVPAGISSTEKRAVVEATLAGGAHSAVIVKEPILAALGAGIPINKSQGFMVIDIGGGTTDVAVISVGGIVSCTSVKCAGNKIDAALIEYCKRAHGLAIGEQTAEDIKKEHISALLLSPDETFTIKGRDLVNGLPKTVTLSSNELVKAIDSELKQIVRAIKEVLQKIPPELASDIIDGGITMTGGTSQLRNLSALIEKQTGVHVRVAENALFSVVEGTGVLLAHLHDYQRSILIKK